MSTLVLIRHGESLWNLQNRFTGWIDVDLTPEGIIQMQRAGVVLRDANWQFDVAYTRRCLYVRLETLHPLSMGIVRHYGLHVGADSDRLAVERASLWRRPSGTMATILCHPATVV